MRYMACTLWPQPKAAIKHMHGTCKLVCSARVLHPQPSSNARGPATLPWSQHPTRKRHQAGPAAGPGSTEAANVEVLDCAVRLVRPAPVVAAVPLLISSPHSGTCYPPSFKPMASRDKLQQTEDSYVDELWAGAPKHGATLLAALFPRCFIDPNRAPDDIDPQMLAAPWPGPYPLRPGPKCDLGLGLIRRLAGPGNPIYDRPLPPEEVLHRIKDFYDVYHGVMRGELDMLYGKFGQVALLDAHSMKSRGNETTPDGPGAVRPDVVVGDLDGAACAAWLTECVVEGWRSLGYTVKVNDPYKGAHTLRTYGSASEGRHAIQVEVNRSLYMVEETRQKLPDGFNRLQQDCSTVAMQMAAVMRERSQRCT